MNPATNKRSYALGHSEPELERLSRQAQAFGPFTRQLFEQAGISDGMRILDVGSGAGEVVGVDRSRDAVEWATARAHSRQIGNVKFREGDPTVMEFDRQFDAVVGRLVLMYYPDPVDAVRRLAGHLRDGGLIVFQELDTANARSL